MHYKPPASKKNHPLAEIKTKNHIGIDESGKGDYFGALVVSGVFLPVSATETVQKQGVKDSKKISDREILRLANYIEENFPHHTFVLAPPNYNDYYDKFKNLNKLLAYAHAKVITALVAQTSCTDVISDKFGADHLIPSFLSLSRVSLTQVTKGERDLAVACASIVARAHFIQNLAELSQKHGITLPKGASNFVKQQARNIHNRFGKNKLREIAKIHFKMF